MDDRLKANIFIDRTEVILSNLMGLTDPEKDCFKVSILDVVVSLETAIEQLQQAQDHISNIHSTLGLVERSSAIQL